MKEQHFMKCGTYLNHDPRPRSDGQPYLFAIHDEIISYLCKRCGLVYWENRDKEPHT